MQEGITDDLLDHNHYGHGSSDPSKRGESAIENSIGNALVRRVYQAHVNNEKFKVYFVLPLLPEGEIDVTKFDSNPTKVIMHFQYAGINRDPPDVEGRPRNRTIFTYWGRSTLSIKFIRKNSEIPNVGYVLTKLVENLKSRTQISITN